MLSFLRNLRQTITVYDSDGNQVALINTKFIEPGREMHLTDWNGEIRGILKVNARKWFGSEYWVEKPSGERIFTVKGKVTKHEYKTIDDETGQVVAEVNKKWISIRDSYAVKIHIVDFDPFFAVLIPLAIDLSEHPSG